MIAEIINENFCRTNQNYDDWRHAIRSVGQILVDNGCAEESYVDDMIAVVEEFGPYIVIAPGIALAHGRPGTGAKEIGVAVVTLENPINFGHEENDPVKLILGLAAVDGNSHLEVIKDCIKFLSDESLEIIFKCESPEELSDYLKSFN